MFYVLSKIIGFALIPSHFLLGVGVLGLVILKTRFVRFGVALMATSIVFLLAAGFLPFGSLLMLPLEQRFPRAEEGARMPAGIVVLGGVVDPVLSKERGHVQLSDAAERVVAAVGLARRYPDAKLLFSGGDSDESSPIEADYVIRLWEEMGIPRGRMLAERRARNTAENASFSKELAAPKPGERWLLVTSAFHMPRAIGTFRTAGFPVEPYPVDYQTAGMGDAWQISDNALAGLARLDAATHEWIGLAVYWLTGRTNALFPGPQDESGGARH